MKHMFCVRYIDYVRSLLIFVWKIRSFDSKKKQSKLCTNVPMYVINARIVFMTIDFSVDPNISSVVMKTHVLLLYGYTVQKQLNAFLKLSIDYWLKGTHHSPK